MIQRIESEVPSSAQRIERDIKKPATAHFTKLVPITLSHIPDIWVCYCCFVTTSKPWGMMNGVKLIRAFQHLLHYTPQSTIYIPQYILFVQYYFDIGKNLVQYLGSTHRSKVNSCYHSRVHVGPFRHTTKRNPHSNIRIKRASVMTQKRNEQGAVFQTILSQNSAQWWIKEKRIKFCDRKYTQTCWSLVWGLYFYYWGSTAPPPWRRRRSRLQRSSCSP